MYFYTFILTPANKKAAIDYTAHTALIHEAVTNCNNGITYLRDSKTLSVNSIEPRALNVTLDCKTPLLNSNRCLSAFSRELLRIGRHAFGATVYHKSLFSIKLISQNSSLDRDADSISDAALLKAIVNLLYAYTATSQEEAERKKTIRQVKELIKPYLDPDD